MASFETRSSRQLTSFPNSLATTAMLWSRTEFLQEFTQVLEATAAWEGVMIQRDSHGVRFIDGNMTVGHLRWDGQLDLHVRAHTREHQRVIEERAGGELKRPDRFLWTLQTSMEVARVVRFLRLGYLRCRRSLEIHGFRN